MPLLVAEVGSPLAARAYRTTPLIALETDAPLAEVPAAVRRAADLHDGFDLGRWSRSETQHGAQGTIVWFRGERLITGESEYIRRDLHRQDQRTFIPVHLPCSNELELVGLQPRWYAGEPDEDSIHQAIRVAAPATTPPLLRDFFEEGTLPWIRLYRALLLGSTDAQNGLAALEEFRSIRGLHRTLEALALRNQAAVLLHIGDFDQTRRLIDRGIATFPGYAELHYLAALTALAAGNPTRAVQQLRQATRKSDPRLVGCGGENSYRAHWLLATISEAAGNEAVAFHHFRAGLHTRPAYEPSVVGLLKHRFPEDAMKQLGYDLAGLARREPKYIEPVVYYLLLHGNLEIVRRILETHPIATPVRAKLTERLQAYSSSGRRPAAPAETPGVCLVGPLFAHSSLARINREIGAALLRSPDWYACLEPHGFGTHRHGEFPQSESLELGLMRRSPAIRLTIRHHWPPNFRRPSAGKLAMILPWEYGAVPRRWIEGIRSNADEVWAPSAFVRQVLIEGGTPADRIRVIPNGVDTSNFRPEGPQWKPSAARRFVFLFVGGAIRRKGIDVLVQAYGRAFSSRDDVTLIVKEIGSDTFYRHMSLAGSLRRAKGRHDSPHVEVLSDELSDDTLANLYRGADAFVLPYRAEGFAMPVAEAMACGKPVIVTAAGPAPEFVPAELGYWVSARRTLVPEPPPPLGKLAGDFTWFEPDVEELAARMREVYENREEAGRRGAAAAEHVRDTLSWERVCRIYLDRISALLGSSALADVDAAVLLTEAT
jgi:glycosyltransferase involved in cell wall biosynthesis